MSLRDTLLRVAELGLIQAYWSEEIIEETTRNLVALNIMTRAQATRLHAALTRAFPEAAVSNYAGLITSLRNHEKDRHVVAAAIKCGASVIVTANLKDFDPLPDGIKAQSPDTLLCSLFEANPSLILNVLHEQVGGYDNPPIPFDELLAMLMKLVPGFVAMVCSSR